MSVFPQFEQDLYAAAARVLPDHDRTSGSEQRRQAPRRRLVLRRVGGMLPGALAITVAVAIAAIAIGTLHGRRTARHTPTSLSRSAPGIQPVHVARAELLRSISVLRHPQSRSQADPKLINGFSSTIFGANHRPPADGSGGLPRNNRNPAYVVYRQHPRADAALLRTVTVRGTGLHLLLAPTTYQPSPQVHTRTEGINVVFGVGTGPIPVTVSTFLDHGVLVGPARLSGGRVVDALLVPDGVARVTLGPATRASLALALREAVAYRLPQHQLAQIIASLHRSVSVTENIAAFPFHAITISTASASATSAAARHDSGTGHVAVVSIPMVWYAANGKVIRRTSTKLRVSVDIDHDRRHS